MTVDASRTSTPASLDHLGDRVSALVDGALPRADHEIVLGHVAACATCRAAMDAERLAKQWVSHLAVPEPGMALVGRLLDVAAPRPVGAARPAVRSLAALSGLGATAAAVLLLGATAAPATNVATPGPVTGPSPRVSLLATTVSFAPPPALRRSRPAATGLPRAFDTATLPGPTPPLVEPVSLAFGVAR